MTTRSEGATLIARLWAKVDKNGPVPPHRSDLGPCWAWTASLTHNGYPRFKHGGVTYVAHRVVYELLVGPIPDGLELDHLCRNTHCVNPKHCEPVTPRVNVLRGETIVAENAAKTHCKRGHPLSGDNLFVRRDGRRRCRTCERASAKRQRNTDEYRAAHAAAERDRRATRRTP